MACANVTAFGSRPTPAKLAVINDRKKIGLWMLCGLVAIAVIIWFQITGLPYYFSRATSRLTAENLDKVLSAVAWPTVALLIAFLFRQPIRDLVNRLTDFKPFGDGGASAAFHPPATGTPQAVPPAPGGPVIDEKKVGQLFWLGSDLHSLVWHLLTNSDRDKIHFYLRQANSHMKKAGLAGSPIQQVMQRLYDEGRKKISSDWTPALRRQYAQDVSKIISGIAAIAEAQQGPSFVGEVPDDA